MTRFLILAAGALVVGACADGRDQPPAPVVYQGSQPSSQTTARPAPSGAPAKAPAPATSSSEASAEPTSSPQPVAAAPSSGQTDGRGVTFYDGYQTVTARQGDTVDTMARRVGIDGAELAAYNGLSTLYTPVARGRTGFACTCGGLQSRNQRRGGPCAATRRSASHSACTINRIRLVASVGHGGDRRQRYTRGDARARASAQTSAGASRTSGSVGFCCRERTTTGPSVGANCRCARASA